MKKLFSLGILLSIPILCCLPLLSKITDSTIFFLLCSSFHSSLMVVFTVFVNIIQLFTQMSAPSNSLPIIFAVSNILGYLASGLFTFLVSSVFGLSLSNVAEPHYSPLDYQLAFYLSAFLILLSHTPLPFVRDVVHSN